MTGGGDGHGRRLSAVDASFLRMESPQAHMHVGCAALLSPPPDGGRPTVQELRWRVAGRLDRLPRCRQRLQPAPLGLGEPRWVDDPDFDLAEHVRVAGAPGEAVSLAHFAALRDAVLSEPLDRRRPLWQVVFVPRLADGRMGLIGRVHHAVADGMAALQLAALLIDLEDDDVAAEDALAWSARPPPGSARNAVEALLDPVRLTGTALHGAARGARHPRDSARRALTDARQLAVAVRRDALPRAGPSLLNAALGGRRTLHTYRVAKADLHAAKGAERATLNDVGLALVAGALRTLTIERDEPVAPLKAMLPVSVREAHEVPELGNRLSMTTLWLPLHLDSAEERLASVCEQTRRFKHTGRVAGNQLLIGAIGLLRGPLRDVALRASASPRAYNLIVSNISGPRAALRVLGAEVEEIYPVVPIGQRHALAVGMLAYHGEMFFGLHADPDAVPEAAWLPQLLAAELEALSAGRPATRRSWS